MSDSQGRVQHVGLSMSGGGHRASLFGLGALMYLIDAGKGPELAAVASVSGGSLTNGWVGLETDLTTVSPAAFRSLASRLAVRIARKGTLWSSWLVYALLAAMALPVLGAVVATVCTGLRGTVIAWPIALLLTGIVAQRRSWVARRTFESSLFHGRRLAQMHHSVDHVLVATELQAAEAAYFSGRFVYSWRDGFGGVGDIHVATAAQASAALPGAFPPVAVPKTGLGLAKPTALKSFLLSDGGVYDNMGTEWMLRASSAFEPATMPPTPAPNRVDEVIIVNSSAAKQPSARPSIRTPILGELKTLLAVTDIMYDQTTALRRRLLNTRYRIAQYADSIPRGLANDGLRGATIQIDRSPYELPNQWRHGDTDRAQRARAVLGVLGDEAAWQREADANKGVGTTLSKIPAERAASLLRHAYVLTMANAHVLLDYPLLAVPTIAESQAWLK